MDIKELLGLIKNHPDISDVHFHHNALDGSIELNIIFKDGGYQGKMWDVYKEVGIRCEDACAVWE